MSEPGFGAGFVLGLGIAGLIAEIVILSLFSSPRHVLVRRTDTGIICHVDKVYPAVNCAAILTDLGPRLSRVKVSR